MAFGFRTPKNVCWLKRECHSLHNCNGRSFSSSQLPFSPLQRLKCHLFSGASAARFKAFALAACSQHLQRSKSLLFAAYSQHIGTAAISSLLQRFPSCIEVLTEEPTVTCHCSAGGHFGRHRKRLRRPPSENRRRSSNWSWGDHPGQYQSGQRGHGRCRLARVERCAFEKVSQTN